jgi:tetratricopeptide repeat protein
MHTPDRQAHLSVQTTSLNLLRIALFGVGTVAFCATLFAQQASQPNSPGAPASDVSNIPKPATGTLEGVSMRNSPGTSQQGKVLVEKEDCLLPPLNQWRSVVVPTTTLKIPSKAKKEYEEACSALKNKKIDNALEHLRKAVKHYPKYSFAWVTLGQVLAAKQETDEARRACAQGSTADPSYVPAYLCQADIAARAHAWNDVLNLSARAIEVDPSGSAVSYEYYAAANLNLHRLPAAEKSGLRAVEIDRDHHEPRIHFVLAQIYEAEGDFVREIAQLREYLQYCDNRADAEMVERYLSELERLNATSSPVDSSARSDDAGSLAPSMQVWEPPDIDENVPPVLSKSSCPLSQILQETSRRTLDLIDNMQRFSASERIEQIDFDKNGKRRSSGAETLTYVAQIEDNSSGYPSIREYRSVDTGIPRGAVVDFGAAAFALMFHPSHIANFDFRCEGLAELQGSPAWQLHFEESADLDRSFSAISVGHSLNLIRLKGRAWIAPDSFNVLRIETDLVAPLAQIKLRRLHQVITYTPVGFPGRKIKLWLPESSSLYIAHRGNRYQRVHTFSQFQLFSVESTDVVKAPAVEKLLPIDALSATRKLSQLQPDRPSD